MFASCSGDELTNYKIEPYDSAPQLQARAARACFETHPLHEQTAGFAPLFELPAMGFIAPTTFSCEGR